MSRILRCLGLALALTALPALVVQADDKKPDEKKADDKKADDKKADDKPLTKEKKEAVEKLRSGGQFTGKLTRWGGTDKSFTVSIDVPVINAAEVQAMQQAQLNYQKSLAARDINGARAHQKEVEQHKAKLYKNEAHPVEFVQGDTMKVRILHPMGFDDKGSPKKLTPKELAKRKGPDKSLPGYEADLSDVRQDSTVTVYIPKKKPAKAGAAKDDLADSKYEAIMLVIVSDAPPAK